MPEKHKTTPPKSPFKSCVLTKSAKRAWGLPESLYPRDFSPLDKSFPNPGNLMTVCQPPYPPRVTMAILEHENRRNRMIYLAESTSPPWHNGCSKGRRRSVE